MQVWWREKKQRELAIAFAAGAALLCAALANFLSHNEYPYFRPEVGIVVAGLLLIAAAMSPFYCAQRQWGRSLLEGLLVTLFLELNSTPTSISAAAGVAVAAFTLWRKVSLTGPMALIGTIIVLTTALGIGGGPGWIRSAHAASPTANSASGAGKPAILHLILDEHIGIEGLPANEPDARRLREELRAFYLNRGFALYGSAYSQHMHTVNAIPHVLNYGAKLGKGANRRGALIGPTIHLNALTERGFNLTIFQSDFADFCTGATFDECVTYNSSSLRPTLQLPINPVGRAKLIALKFAALSDLAKRSEDPWNFVASKLIRVGLPIKKLDFWNDTKSSSASAIVSFDALVDRLRGAQPGQVYFGHILLPHYPYIVDSRCRYLPWDDWETRKSSSSLSVRQHDYYNQVRCTMRKVASAIDAFSQSPAGQNAIIIVHGDHGSRLTNIDPMQPTVGMFSDADMIAAFSTLFAVRTASARPTYYSGRRPIAELLRDFAASDFRTPPEADRPHDEQVFLDNADWKPTSRIRLPSDWQSALARPASRHAGPKPISH